MHNLFETEEGEAMMYVGDAPWHGLGTRFETAPKTSEEAIQAAKLDWQVLRVKLYAVDGTHWTQVPSRRALVPSDRWGKPDCPVFADVPDSYEPVQNEDAFRFFDPLIQQGKATYETAGGLGNGEKVWVLAKLTGDMEIAGDTLERYLLLSNGHNGRTAVQVMFTPIRVVCANTLSVALENREWHPKF